MFSIELIKKEQGYRRRIRGSCVFWCVAILFYAKDTHKYTLNLKSYKEIARGGTANIVPIRIPYAKLNFKQMFGNNDKNEGED